MVDEYDFEWDGETEVVGDEEAQTAVLAQEPSGNQQGVEPPGAQAAYADLTNFGIYNGNFRQGPPDPAANLDVASSTTGSNFMPGWRFVQSSNSNITAKQVRDTASPSGSNLRFTFASGSASDEAYVEQVIDIGGSRGRYVGHVLRGWQVLVSGANVGVRMSLQYQDTNGDAVGDHDLSILNVPTSAGQQVVGSASDGVSPPSNARILRVRLIAARSSGTAAASVDVSDIRMDRSAISVTLAESGTPASHGPGTIAQEDGVIYIAPEQRGVSSAPRLAVSAPDDGVFFTSAATGVTYNLTGHLVPIPFVLVNVPDSATTAMVFADNALGVGRHPMPSDGSIVMLSYRASASVSAGSMSIRATVDGTQVWTAFAAAALAQQDTTSQAPGTDTFSEGEALGVDLVTSPLFAPTSMDIGVILWVLLDYAGT